MILRIAVLAGIAIALIAGACGGDGDDGANVEELRARITAVKDGTFTVTYARETVRTSGSLSRETVWYHDGTSDFAPGLDRTDSQHADGLHISIVAYGEYSCAPTASEPQCIAKPCCSPSLFDAWFMRPALEGERVSVVETRNETMLGHDVVCYEIEVDPTGLSFSISYSTYELCLTDDGLLLFAQTGPLDEPDMPDIDGMVNTMTAVDVKTTVADDAFEPPYEVVPDPARR